MLVLQKLRHLHRTGQGRTCAHSGRDPDRINDLIAIRPLASRGLHKASDATSVLSDSRQRHGDCLRGARIERAVGRVGAKSGRGRRHRPHARAHYDAGTHCAWGPESAVHALARAPGSYCGKRTSFSSRIWLVGSSRNSARTMFQCRTRPSPVIRPRRGAILKDVGGGALSFSQNGSGLTQSFCSAVNDRNCCRAGDDQQSPICSRVKECSERPAHGAPIILRCSTCLLCCSSRHQPTV